MIGFKKQTIQSNSESDLEILNDNPNQKLLGGSLLFEDQLKIDSDQRRVSQFINGVRVKQD